MSDHIIVFGGDHAVASDMTLFARPQLWALADVANPTRLSRLLYQAHERFVSQVWLLPASGYQLTDGQLDYARAQGWQFLPRTTAATTWLVAKRAGYSGEVAVHVVSPRDTTWGDADAWECLRGIQAFHAATGVWWQWSNGSVGQRLMRATHSGPHATQLDLPQGAPPPATNAAIMHGDGAYNWSRKLRPEEVAGRVINSFDVNGQYLAACSSLALGVGEWTRAATHTDAELAPRDAPGYWHVSIPAHGATPLMVPIVDGRSILRNSDYMEAWISTPTMQLLREMDVVYWLNEAYWWPERRQYLTPWYKRLRDARAELMTPGPGHVLALDAVKGAYSTGIAYLNGHWKHERPDALYRPDWRHAVISQARANEWRGLWRVYAVTHQAPVALGADCAYYLTPPGGADALGFRVGTGLGHWKRKDFDVPADLPSVVRVLTSGLAGPSRVKLLQMTLNAIREGRDADAIWREYEQRHVDVDYVTRRYDRRAAAAEQGAQHG